MGGIECAFFGVLGRDAESKVSAKGKSYLRMAVRVGGGEESQWVSILSFDPEAIAVADKLVKGAKVYVECHGLKIDKWTGQDGKEHTGLSAMSFHTRLPQIGANRPRRDGDGAPANARAQRSHDDLDDAISF
jgi:single-stranded DNA-binding protein